MIALCDDSSVSPERWHKKRSSSCLCFLTTIKRIYFAIFFFFFHFFFFIYYSNLFPLDSSRDVEPSWSHNGIKHKSRKMKGNKWALIVASANRPVWIVRRKLLWFARSHGEGYLLPSTKFLWGIASWPGKPFLQQMALAAYFFPIRAENTLRMPEPSQSSLVSCFVCMTACFSCALRMIIQAPGLF